jgi:hydrogenase nickel incorporation protein HypA/HybF
MHELSLIQALFAEVESQLAPHAGARVCALHVRVGELAGVDPELFRSAYEVCRNGGPLAAAELELSFEPAEWKCSACQVDISRGQVLTCSLCGEPARLARGGEIFLDRIEAEIQHV